MCACVRVCNVHIIIYDDCNHKVPLGLKIINYLVLWNDLFDLTHSYSHAAFQNMCNMIFTLATLLCCFSQTFYCVFFKVIQYSIALVLIKQFSIT